jgi:UDP-glucose 4-epimerase
MDKSVPILVTGGAGYIGSHVVMALREADYQVVIIDDLSTGRREAVPGDVELVVGDVADGEVVASVLADHQVKFVMHFAGSIIVEESVSDPLKYYRNNTSASRNLIESCVKGGVAGFVFSSTAAVYGIPEAVPVTEQSPVAPINPYGHSKLMTEQVLCDVAPVTDLRYAILRYFNVAGADPAGRSGQVIKDATHLIKVACEVATGRREAMSVFGTDYPTLDGTCIRDFIHVSDLADAHLRVLEWLGDGDRSATFNCGYGRGYSVREVLKAVGDVAGHELNVIEGPRRAGDSPEVVADSSLLRQETGWSPRHEDLSLIVKTALDWEKKTNPV